MSCKLAAVCVVQLRLTKLRGNIIFGTIYPDFMIHAFYTDLDLKKRKVPPWKRVRRKVHESFTYYCFFEFVGLLYSASSPVRVNNRDEYSDRSTSIRLSQIQMLPQKKNNQK